MILDFVKKLFQLKLDQPSALVDAYFIGHSKTKLQYQQFNLHKCDYKAIVYTRIEPGRVQTSPLNWLIK